MPAMTKKVALVMGGASGIGLAIAERLAKEGALVFLTGRRVVDVEAAVAQIGPAARSVVADASNPADIERVIATVGAQGGQIDALVYNAGIMEPADLEESIPEHFDRHFAVNVRGALLTMRAAAPRMAAGGSALFLGSVADVKGATPYGTYAATKAALRSYVRSWTGELAPRGIHVNILSAGPTDTAMMASIPDEMRDGIVSQIPLARMGRVEEAAAAAWFLLSDEASFITGAELYVDGGMAQV
ncbi:MAG: SDR family oxidoreductase [Mesorhizobium sp.]|uniref:SDR family NAD(P)-dependent oxidoreductase n=1 Tax=unclassified Mesorhizobium TaxID=325217 RepID=UPI000F76288D|nr:MULTISPECIES: SDR family oxidoreductase [unclassified Mesorhizobium]RVC69370.1 SDR family oxidoreductase [Mesorhizobium sp. M00.F.Ca.ET.038.03.1.1]AZO37457.1 SDR family oxidoreductase [Mesorhizobium sp. M2A.F.Ca.ET.046.03.2.1]RWB46932.1 MAG: SDR family oxidoreductase [Mesorhizobium sp.]RWE08925.1 MAG: SDR family oxidoreductase [Mesorhizobium sp.]RWE95781.1 MAG: SDR family oxidoreductase [Mesorhizobium sp.]